MRSVDLKALLALSNYVSLLYKLCRFFLHDLPEMNKYALIPYHALHTE